MSDEPIEIDPEVYDNLKEQMDEFWDGRDVDGFHEAYQHDLRNGLTFDYDIGGEP